MITLPLASTFGVGAVGSDATYAFNRISSAAATAPIGATLAASTCARTALAHASHAPSKTANAKTLRRICICENCEGKKLCRRFMPPQKARQHPTPFDQPNRCSPQKPLFQLETLNSQAARVPNWESLASRHSHYENFGKNIPVSRACSSNFGPNSCAKNFSSCRALM
jgi:hypothetical protein